MTKSNDKDQDRARSPTSQIELNESHDSQSQRSLNDEKETSSRLATASPCSNIVENGSNRSLISPGVCGLLRILTLDLPVAVAFAMCLGTLSLHRMHDLYFLPELKALRWSDERWANEPTYYQRICKEEENFVTATTSEELFLSAETDTTEDVYNHFLLHGFSGFPSLLTEETATALRDYANEQNPLVPRDESDFLIGAENRYFLVPGVGDHPALADALVEVANNEFFRSALEMITGE